MHAEPVEGSTVVVGFGGHATVCELRIAKLVPACNEVFRLCNTGRGWLLHGLKDTLEGSGTGRPWPDLRNFCTPRGVLVPRVRNMKHASVGVAVATLCLSAMAQTPSPPQPKPCTAAEHRQFDFWIGRWDVFTPDGKKAGVNVIEAIDGGCALVERWQGGGGFSGTSLNSWDAPSRLWRQHWVDNQGGLLRLAGGLDGLRMVLGSDGPHPSKPGVTLRQRIAWTPLPDGAVRQLWETSDDDGKTWTTAFDGRYLKSK